VSPLYWLLAIQQGNVDSMFNLGHYYRENKDCLLLFALHGQIQEPQRDQSMESYYLMAIKHGHVKSMHKLGNYYYNLKNCLLLFALRFAAPFFIYSHCRAMRIDKIKGRQRANSGAPKG